LWFAIGYSIGIDSMGCLSGVSPVHLLGNVYRQTLSFGSAIATQAIVSAILRVFKADFRRPFIELLN